MNIFIAIMLVCAVLGLADKAVGGRWGLAAAFDDGLSMCGLLALSMCGLYCMGVTLVQKNADAIAEFSSVLPFDPSLIISALLASDMGGYPISARVAADPAIGLFSGVLVSSTLGMVIGFQLPVSLGTLPKNDSLPMLRGLFIGVGTLPLSLFIGGLFLKISPWVLLMNLAPVTVLCILLIAALLKAGRIAAVFLQGFGALIKILSYVTFAIVIAGLYFPQFNPVDPALSNEVFTILVKMLAIICGSLVFSHLMTTYCKGPLQRLGQKLGINEYAALGLLASLTTTLAMLPLFSKMDERGKILNGALSATGAYVIGGQMAFVAGSVDSQTLTVYIATKFLSFAFAAVAVLFFTRRSAEAGAQP